MLPASESALPTTTTSSSILHVCREFRYFGGELKPRCGRSQRRKEVNSGVKLPLHYYDISQAIFLIWCFLISVLLHKRPEKCRHRNILIPTYLNCYVSGVDYWRILQLVLGLLLFLLAPKLAANSIFYYLTGMSIGTLASMLVLVYILSRFVPKVGFHYFLIGNVYALP